MSRISRNSGSCHSHPRFAINLAALVGMVLAPIPCLGQTRTQPASAAHTAPKQKQAFEVASIRPVDPHATGGNTGQFGPVQSNRFTMRSMDVRLLIQLAYGTDKISGGPEWAYSQNYSVNAKVEGDALLTQKQMRPLLQNLLEERFHLKIHREQKIVPGYALVIAKGGPRLQPTNGGVYFGIGGSPGSSELKYQNESVENFAKVIGYAAFEQPVVDKTGVEGMYDFDLKFTPEVGPYRDDPRFANLPDIFTAVQVQLGLKLVKQKVPVDSLVIDHVDRISTEN
jgi:uncharacterized protein (TIGR03435 family)